ncbi:Diacyl glycerol kinase epsilon [Carabus blaptoides fortunei]
MAIKINKQTFPFEVSSNMWSVECMFGNYCGLVVPIVSTITFAAISYMAFKFLFPETKLPVRAYRDGHNWQSIKISAKPWYCSICQNLLVSGFGVYCDCCNICADQECIRKTVHFACKSTVDVEREEHMQHQWVQGNLPLGASCVFCEDECFGLVDFQCCWCQCCVHFQCQKYLKGHLCDLGQYRPLIVPLWTARVTKTATSAERFTSLERGIIPWWQDWAPLIIIGNCKSGNGDCSYLMSELRHLLNPFQVVDLSETSPEVVLSWIKRMQPVKINLLVAGGDGTVAWILNTIEKMQLSTIPGVAIVPTGTGNDLSRVLGWGAEHAPYTDGADLLQKILKADPQQLDRWSVELKPFVHLGLPILNKSLFMYNYLSIGVDAQVALDFHRTRESGLYPFSSRIFNKLLYLCFGTQQVVAAGCRGLNKRVEVYLDGELVTLPDLEAIVVLNIPSWGAGVDLWALVDEDVPPQSYSDGIVEVVGIYSSFHMAQLQVGLSSPYFIGQAAEVQIRLLTPSPIQVDGEPWAQIPTVINIKRKDQAEVLVNQTDIYDEL